MQSVTAIVITYFRNGVGWKKCFSNKDEHEKILSIKENVGNLR